MGIARKQHFSFIVVAFLAIIFCGCAPASAQGNSAIAQGFQGDNSNGEIVAGALVSVKTDNPQIVQLATTDSADRLIGIVDQDPLVVISANNKQAQVVLSGATNALVTDLNGTINTGDKIAISPIAGVGMKASSDGQIVGTAQANLDLSKSQTQTVTDSKGGQHTVHVGFVSLQIGVAYYQAQSSSFLPSFIQGLANNIAGRQVSLIRIALCGVLLLASFIGIGVLIYGSVRSAMISLGRNPLASTDIRKSLYQVGAIVIGVLGVTLVAGYIILIV
ncbi:MAG TPA: hypothetical protein VLG40_03345 [Candidatus Saccharimonas sp.]|nr:hypothetical protein [Candidatus Saccharimonas sp.]